MRVENRTCFSRVVHRARNASVKIRVICAIAALVIAAAVLYAPDMFGAGRAKADDSNVTATVTSGQSGVEDRTTTINRDRDGVVSQLNPSSHNPYNNLITVKIDIGAEFAEYDGSNSTEAIVIKCEPGDYIQLPKIKAKEGYTFVGWNQGGMTSPIWDPDTTTVQMSSDAQTGKSTVIDALYMDENGDGFCACGAWEEEYFADKQAEYKSAYDSYLSNGAYKDKSGSAFNAIITATVIIVVIVVIIALILITVSGLKRSNRKDENETDISAPKRKRVPPTKRRWHTDAMSIVSGYEELHPNLRPAIEFIAAVEAASETARNRDETTR